MELSKDVNLTNGNLFKKILVFSLPIMASSLLQLLYNAADLIVCGQFGSSSSVAAISNTTSLVNLMVQLFIGMSVGSNVLMARAYATKDRGKAKTILGTSLIFSIAIGVILSIIGFFGSSLFLGWMKTPDEVIGLSSSYFRIYSLGFVFSMIYNFGSALIRATGDTKRPFLFLCIAGLVNIVFNLFFVIVCKLDVVGVALGTVISEFVSAGLIVLLLVKGNSLFKLNLKSIIFTKHELIEVIKIGIPAGIQNSVFSIANLLIQSSINSLGKITMDADGASSSIEGFVYATMNAVAQATLVFVAANYAVGNKKNIKKSIIHSSVISLIFAVISGGLVIIFGKQLLELYIKDPEAISIAYRRLVLLCGTYYLCGLIDVFSFAVRGIGYSITPTIITALGCCVYRIVWVLTIFKIDSFHKNETLSAAYPISWLMTSIAHLICMVIFIKRLHFENEDKYIDFGASEVNA